MKYDFKIGDPVVCINNNKTCLDKDTIYTIVSINNNFNHDCIDDDICGIRVSPSPYPDFYYATNRFTYALKELRKEKIKKIY